jgi:hypothetical protein
MPAPAIAERPATGAIQFLRGEITKTVGDKLSLRLPSGREVTVPVDTNTNMVCPSRLPEEAEVLQEQDRAKHQGFRIGDCPFRTDHAERSAGNHPFDGDSRRGEDDGTAWSRGPSG